MSNTYGIVEYFGCNDGSYPCGYCKGVRKGDTDYGMWAHRLAPDHYQNLIDRNWRRSGKYCYKPILSRTCCPMYTIRCNALDFKLKKSQKKVIKKFNRFLMTGEKSSKRRESEVQSMETIEERTQMEPTLDQTSQLSLSLTNPSEAKPRCEQRSTSKQKVTVVGNKTETAVNERQTTSKLTKAKSIRKERKLNKIIDRMKCDRKTAMKVMAEEFNNKVMNRNKAKTFEQYMNEPDSVPNNSHKLEIKYVSTTCSQYQETFDASHGLYQKYQMAIHGDPLDKCTRSQYKRFLIDSPLEREDFDREITSDLPDHFGSYHQQYWLDNKLIAVGVLDILPHCVSSVYLYYDPEYDFLSLGTYSALREIYLVRKLQQFVPNLVYYYMGFYIHTCPKMRYKGKFSPSELLCGEALTWVPIEKCIPKLDVSKYCRFDDNPNAVDSDGTDVEDSEIMLLYSKQALPYPLYKSIRAVTKKEDQEIKEYAKLVGKKCSSDILLYRS